MFVKQLSVFVENKKGRLAAILAALSAKNVDICALSLADTTDFGILRVIVDKPDVAQQVLREEGVISKAADVLAVVMDDTPGSLAEILRFLSSKDISVEYMYAFTGKNDDKAVVVMKVNDLLEAEKILSENGIAVIHAENLYRKV